MSGPNDLLDNLASTEMAVKTGLPGGAEPAGHGATGLGGHADGGAVPVVHQHRFDQGPVGQSPQRLDRLAVVGVAFGGDLQGGGGGVVELLS